MRMRNSLSARLLVALVLPMTAFAVVLGGGGAVVTRQVVDRTADRLLAGAVRAISETMTVEDGAVRVNVPPWALGVLDNPERDRVYYSVYQAGRLLTGYGDLPQPASMPDIDAPDFAYADYRGVTIRRASQAVSLVGTDAPVVVSIAQSLDSRQAVRNELMTALLLLEGLLIALAACLVWPAVRWNLRPLQAMQRQLEARSADGRGSYRPVDLRDVPDEIAPLLGAFNELATDLAASNDSVRRFTADASHQMRTPLTILKTHLSLLEGRQRRSQADREAIRDVREASDRLGRLLLQLLALAHADHAEQVALRSLDLGEHVRYAIGQMAPTAARAGVEISVLAVTSPVRALASPEFLSEMLANLLDNAIKYGGGRIEISVATDADAAIVMIDDAGPGVAPDDRRLVFGRFTRLAATQAVAGSGLGLSIVETLARRQGASVSLEDGRLGGLRVVLYFRLPPAAANVTRHQ